MLAMFPCLELNKCATHHVPHTAHFKLSKLKSDTDVMAELHKVLYSRPGVVRGRYFGNKALHIQVDTHICLTC